MSRLSHSHSMGQRFLVGGMDTRTHSKQQHKGDGAPALVVRRLPATDPPTPWRQNSWEIENIDADGYAGAGEYIEIIPDRYWSWGVEAPAFSRVAGDQESCK